MSKPWDIPGPETKPDSPGLAEALRLVHTAKRRPPTDADRRVSVFPPTDAARAALRQGKQGSA